MNKSRVVIKAETLFDGKSKLNSKYIVVENGIITEIKSNLKKFDYEGIVTPAFIDGHSHIGLARDGEPSNESEGNEILNQIAPLNNPLNSIYFDDKAMSDSIDFGVLYSCVVPGSGNLIGGQAITIKNFAGDRRKGLLKNCGYKMALGYNPTKTQDWKGARPNTRMGSYSLLEATFDNLIIKMKKEEISLGKALLDIKSHKSFDAKEKKLRIELAKKESLLNFSAEENAINEILSGNKLVKVHVHKEDDVYYLIELVKKYGIKVSLEHGCDIHHVEVFKELKKHNIPVTYGPLLALGYKTELRNASYKSAKLLMDSKVTFGLMTDHPVIHSISLRDTLKFFLIHGMKKAEAISLITKKNADILGLQQLGEVKKGNIGSLLVWDKNPFNLAAMPKTIIAEGKIIRSVKK